MAPKRRKEDPLEHPLPASGEEVSEDEDESSSEGTPPPPQPKPAAQKPHSSSSAGGSRSTPAATKRLSEKRESKTRPRIWSEDDGIAVLKGMVEFQVKNGSSPYSDMNGFHDFIKKSLRADVSKTQLSDKIRHLRSKYMANLEKMNKDESGSSLKPHEKELFHLSKKVWGESNGIRTVKAVDQQPKSSIKKAKKLKSHGSTVLIPHKPEPPASVDGAKEGEEMEIDQNLAPPKEVVDNLVAGMIQGTRDIEEYVMKKGFDLIEGSKKAELEERWAKLHKTELALFVKRVELVYDQARLLLEARK